MAAYVILGLLMIAGSFAQAEEVLYVPHHIRTTDQDQMTDTLPSWDQVERGQASGTMSVVVARHTRAFESVHRTWIDVPEGAELVSVSERCLGWMNTFIKGGYDGRENVYVKEWDVHFYDKVSGKTYFGVEDVCPRPELTRERIIAAQSEGLVQVYTNKVAPLHSENGPMVLVGPRFRNRDDFMVEWISRSTTGMLKIPAHRQVTLEVDSCRPVGLVKVRYAGGTFWVRGLDLDITMAGEKLATTPLGSGAWILCDESTPAK